MSDMTPSFVEFSYATVNHDRDTTPTTEEEYEDHLKASAMSFFNAPGGGLTTWSVSSFSDLKHTYYARVVGGEYKVTQEYMDDDNGLDPQWCVEIIFKPTDTGELTLHYDGLDEIAKVCWVKTPEGFIISDFEGYQALIEGDKITELFPDDDDGVVSMSEILSRQKRKGR
jgi:hypothetical protein